MILKRQMALNEVPGRRTCIRFRQGDVHRAYCDRPAVYVAIITVAETTGHRNAYRRLRPLCADHAREFAENHDLAMPGQETR